MLLNIEERPGVFFTIKKVLEFTWEAIALLGVPMLWVFFVEVGDGGCSGSELSIFYSYLHFTHKPNVENTNQQPLKYK